MATKITQQNTGSQTITTTTETAVITTPAYTYDEPNPFVGGEHSGAGQGVSISGVININPVGAGATSVVVRVRQGTVTGTIVSTITQTVTAASSLELTFEGVDTTRFPASGGVYVVSLQFGAATGNSTVTYTAVDVEGA